MNGQFQFGTGRLLILASAVAAVVLISSSLARFVEIRVLFVVGFGFVVAWVVLRGPNIYTNLSSSRQKWRQVKSRREKLMAKYSREHLDNDEETN